MPDRHAAQKRREAAWRAAGRCYRCGELLPEGSPYKSCASCREKHAKMRKRSQYDDHPEIIKLCMKCEYKDCIGRCNKWVRLVEDLEKREPDFISKSYYRRMKNDDI